MAVLLPKRTNGFRITDKFKKIEEPSYPITSSFYVKDGEHFYFYR